MDINYKNNCRICGLDNGEPVWGENGDFPSFQICMCCGVQFGYDDNGDIEFCTARRRYWIVEQKAQWFEPRYKPLNWSLKKQLRNIPPEFR
jgi:hypothetical protein